MKTLLRSLLRTPARMNWSSTIAIPHSNGDDRSTSEQVILARALSALAAVGLLVAGAHAQDPEPCVISDGGRLEIGSEQSCTMPVDLAASPFSLTEMTMGDGATLVLPARPDRNAKITGISGFWKRVSATTR